MGRRRDTYTYTIYTGSIYVHTYITHILYIHTIRTLHTYIPGLWEGRDN